MSVRGGGWGGGSFLRKKGSSEVGRSGIGMEVERFKPSVRYSDLVFCLRTQRIPVLGSTGGLLCSCGAHTHT